MRYPATEKLEIIQLVERSARPTKWTLDKLGVPRRTFYRWYDRYLTEGADGLVDRAPMPKIVWNKIPDNIREDLHTMALDEPELYCLRVWRLMSLTMRSPDVCLLDLISISVRYMMSETSLLAQT